MLVIRRRAGESFRIGPDVEVRVLAVDPHEVKIGVIAPAEIPILRSELAELNRRAASGWSRQQLQELARRISDSVPRSDAG